MCTCRFTCRLPWHMKICYSEIITINTQKIINNLTKQQMASCHGFSRLVSVYWIWCHCTPYNGKTKQMRWTQFMHWNKTFSILLKYYNPQTSWGELTNSRLVACRQTTTAWLRYYRLPVLHRLQVSHL